MKQSSSLWQIFSIAPHRLMFFGGAVQLVATLLFWCIELIGRTTELWHPLDLTLPSTYAHAFLMVYSIFPLFTLGFLLTTYPKWMNGTAVPRTSYVPSFFLQIVGALLFYVGLFVAKPLLVIAVLLHLLGWFIGYIALIRVFREVKGGNRYHAFNLNFSLVFGLLGEAIYFVFLLTDNDSLIQLSIGLGIWLYLMTMLLIVCHRMLPFFASCVLEPYEMIRPMWTLPFMWICLVGHFIFDQAGRFELLFIFDLPLLLWGLYHTFLWGFFRSFKVRLLSVLFVSLMWFSIGMALYSIKSVSLMLTGEFILGRAPLHALAIGFLTSMVVAMGTRVSLGHSGRPLVMDLFSWLCFWGVQLATVLRVVAEIELSTSVSSETLNLLAGLVWLMSLTP